MEWIGKASRRENFIRDLKDRRSGPSGDEREELQEEERSGAKTWRQKRAWPVLGGQEQKGQCDWLREPVRGGCLKYFQWPHVLDTDKKQSLSA